MGVDKRIFFCGCVCMQIVELSKGRRIFLLVRIFRAVRTGPCRVEEKIFIPKITEVIHREKQLHADFCSRFCPLCSERGCFSLCVGVDRRSICAAEERLPLPGSEGPCAEERRPWRCAVCLQGVGVRPGCDFKNKGKHSARYRRSDRFLYAQALCFCFAVYAGSVTGGQTFVASESIGHSFKEGCRSSAKRKNGRICLLGRAVYVIMKACRAIGSWSPREKREKNLPRFTPC